MHYINVSKYAIYVRVLMYALYNCMQVCIYTTCTCIYVIIIIILCKYIIKCYNHYNGYTYVCNSKYVSN